MQARMKNPAVSLPGALETIQALHAIAAKTGLSATTLELINLRASQINGCAVCLEMHARDLRKAGEQDAKIDTVAGWRDAPFFDDAERSILALTEAVTRLADQADPVPDAIYDEAAKHWDEQQLAGALLSIALINVWNRLNVSTRQVAAGSWA